MAVERVNVIETGSPWKEEHLSRYYFAKDYIKGKVVLDIACGTGFGSEFIVSQKPKEVYSVDVADDAINFTKEKLKGFKNCFVYKQDGTKLSFEDNFFDLIFSIETIEHIDKDEAFLKELFRVLKPSGKLIISTPNGDITNPDGGKPENPFHIREYSVSEFKKLFTPFFNIQLESGQMVEKTYGVVPFLPSFKMQKRSLGQKINKVYWSFALRLPFKNYLHQLLFGHNFYPEIKDYTFLKEDLGLGHVQYYILTPKK